MTTLALVSCCHAQTDSFQCRIDPLVLLVLWSYPPFVDISGHIQLDVITGCWIVCFVTPGRRLYLTSYYYFLFCYTENYFLVVWRGDDMCRSYVVQLGFWDRGWGKKHTAFSHEISQCPFYLGLSLVSRLFYLDYIRNFVPRCMGISPKYNE